MTTRMFKTAALALAAAGAFVVPPTAAALAQDAEAGRVSFQRRCSACHVVQPGQNRVGPSLHGVVGRPAGQVPGFNYSAAMRDSGKVWDEASLDAYIANAREYIPGTRMILAPLANAEERANIVAYLATQR